METDTKIKFEVKEEEYIIINEVRCKLSELDGYKVIKSPLNNLYINNDIALHRNYYQYNNGLAIAIDKNENYCAPVLNHSRSLMDKKGTIVTNLKYNDIFRVKNGYYVGKLDGYYILINQNGQEIKKLNYNVIDCLEGYGVIVRDGLIRVVFNNKWGFIDENFNEIIPCQYDDAHKFNNGIAVVEIGEKRYFINKRNEIVLELPNNFIPLDHNSYLERVIVATGDSDKAGLIDLEGNIIVEEKYNDIEFNKEDLNLIRVNLNNKEGFIDKDGNAVIECKYMKVSLFHDGLARVKYDKNLFGFINVRGEELFKLECEYLDDEFHDGLAKIVIDNKEGYINKNGQVVIETKYTSVVNFCNGKAMVQEGYSRYYINTKGERITKEYDRLGSFSDGLASVCKNGLHGYINEQGEEVIPLIYDSANNFRDGMALVTKGVEYVIDTIFTDPKYYFIDKEGKIVLGEDKVLYNNEIYNLHKQYTLTIHGAQQEMSFKADSIEEVSCIKHKIEKEYGFSEIWDALSEFIKTYIIGEDDYLRSHIEQDYLKGNSFVKKRKP